MSKFRDFQVPVQNFGIQNFEFDDIPGFQV